jgi:membrane protein DedA with SNARE-associated domain
VRNILVSLFFLSEVNLKYLHICFSSMIIGDILSQIGAFAISTISFFGYFGVFILMTMESMIIPIPSELVMPFAGFLAADGRFSFALVILFSSLGSIVGSLISYYIGYYGGNAVVLKFGKYLFLDASDLEKTEKWFAKRGDLTVLISRFIPVVRHLISVPAGIGKMNLKKFCVYTIIGATLWNTFLAYLGYWLGKNWQEVRHYSEYITITVAIILGAAFIFLVIKHIRDKQRSRLAEKRLLKKKR